MRYYLKNRFKEFSGLNIVKALKQRQSSVYASLKKLCELKYLIHENNKYLLSEDFRNFTLDNIFLSTLYNMYQSLNEVMDYNVFDFVNFLNIYSNEIKTEIRKS
jgi:predicted transcriptional regulator